MFYNTSRDKNVLTIILILRVNPKTKKVLIVPTKNQGRNESSR